MTERVCAVVVTYNRKQLLAECLGGLLKQTRALDHVLVVDNASTDGTPEMLAREFPHVEVVRLSENLGGAGGFHAGIKHAYEAGFDWMWVMDDDVEPRTGALEVMLRYAPISDFIHARRDFQGAPFPWEGKWDFSDMLKRVFATDISFENGREWISVNYACFEGGLIHRRVVDRIGYPDARFFVMGDDSVYGYLASLHTNVIYVNYLGLEKKLPPNTDPDRRKIYFVFRNRFLLYEYLRRARAPVSRVSFWIAILRSVLWNLRKRKEIRCAKGVFSIASGLRDGILGRYGRPGWLQ